MSSGRHASTEVSGPVNSSQNSDRGQVAKTRDGSRQAPSEMVPRSSEPVGLSRLGREFAAIGLGKYKECEKFIRENRAILCEPVQVFLEEAVNDISAERLGSAQRRVQQALILRRCVEYGTDWSDWFDDMLRQDDKTVKDFIRDFKQTFASLTNRANETTQGQTGAASQSTGTAGAIAIPGAQGLSQRPQGNPNLTHLGSLPTRRHENQPVLAGIPEGSGPQPPVSRSRTGSNAAASGRHGTPIGTITKKPDELDASYKIRPSKFFVVGRVFAVPWPENAGMAVSTVASDWSSQTEGRGAYGQAIHDKIRRMVVVKNDHGFCLAAPVNTHSGRGLRKSGLSRGDIDAHAIIHMSSTKPSRLDDEPKMIKTPIEVEASFPHRKLDVASRVNFKKVHTIE